MKKKLVKAVRTYLIEDGKVLAIRYILHDNGYYDIPGGRLEENETSEEAALREFNEETGMKITKFHHIGTSVAEYEKRIFHFDVYIVDSYEGEPSKQLENDSMWISLSELEKKPKKFPSAAVINYLKDGMKYLHTHIVIF